MKNRKVRAVGLSAFLLPLAALVGSTFFPAAPAASQDQVGRAIDQTVKSNRASRSSQVRIDRLDDQTRDMLEAFRAASWEAQQLTVYADQLEELVEAQEAEKVSLNRQIEEMERTERELLPLMLRMVEGLERFVALDRPFLKTEREERLASLRKLMANPEATNSDKFKRILEAWHIEAAYGRTLGSERTEIDGRAAEVLRIGRVGLYYLTRDGSACGAWDQESAEWFELPGRYVSDIRKGLRMARDSVAPDLLRLPVPAAASGVEL